jgi:hypothetical protein
MRLHQPQREALHQRKDAINEVPFFLRWNLPELVEGAQSESGFF